MNLDATQAMLIIILAFCARDGLLAWHLIGRILHAPPSPVPDPVPQPIPPGPKPDPVPVPVPVARTPRFTDITATSFAGVNDSISSRTGAYTGTPIDSNRPGVALPFHFTGARPVVRVFYKSRSVDCPIVDVGPWNTRDPYWQTNTRPQAETGADLTGRKTNRAGIDLTPGAWSALGFTGNLDAITATVSWDFVDYLGAAPLPTPSPTPVGTPPWLAAMVDITGTHEVDGDGDSPVILGWATFIGKKFPDMASYCARYDHDSIAWCGLTVAYCMALAGVRPQFGANDIDKFLWADSWRQFGVAVQGGLQPGDVLVFKWANGGHHVTFYDHETDGDKYACRGGNQGDEVNVTLFPMAACIAIRRPA